MSFLAIQRIVPFDVCSKLNSTVHSISECASVVNYNVINLNHHNNVSIKCQLTYTNDPQGGEVSERGRGGVSGGGVGWDFYPRPK